MLLLRVFVLSGLLALLHHLHKEQYQAEIRVRTAQYTSGRDAHTALVTLADPRHVTCAVELLRQARRHGWSRNMVLLAVNYGNFSRDAQEALDDLGVLVVHTAGVLDGFVERGVENVDVYRRLDKRKLRKLEIFFHAILRTYDRWIYVDADGQIDGKLDGFARLRFPEGVSVMMRQNDRTMGKGGLWENELAVEMFTESQMRELSNRFGDRDMAGGTCWFVVEVGRLDTPARMVDRTLEVLCKFRAGFRFNDQTIMALMFYNEMSLFPWCVWEEVPVLKDGLREWCEWNWKMQRKVWGRQRFMYRHLSTKEKSRCVQTHVPDAALQIDIAEVDEHRIDPQADCETALRQWRRRFEGDKTVQI